MLSCAIQTAGSRTALETTVFSNKLLSVFKVDRAYPAQGPCKLPEFLFYGMDKFA